MTEPRLPHYEVRRSEDGESWHWVLKAGNGEILASSETYPTRQHAERGIEDAKAAASKADALPE